MEHTRRLMRAAAAFGRLAPAIGPEAFRRLLDAEPRFRHMFGGSKTKLRDDFMGALTSALIARADVGRFPTSTIRQLEDVARENRKFGVAPRDYPTLGEHLLDVFAERLPPGLDSSMRVAALRGALDEVLTLLADTAEAAERAEGPATYTGRVLEVQRRTRHIAVIRVHCPDPIPFTVGQHIPIRSPLAPGIWRDYSPALPPNPEGLLEFHIRIVDGGAESRPLVVASRPGDEWTFGTPRGRLGQVLDAYRARRYDGPPTGRHHLPEAAPRDILMVAGGTGLAPLRALIMEAADLPSPPPIHLVYGARTPGELYDLRTMVGLANNLPNLTLSTAVEKRIDEPLTNPGPFSSHPAAPMPRLGVAADVAARIHRPGELAGKTVLIAGRGEMIDVTRERLVEAGADPRFIHHDPVAKTTVAREARFPVLG
ncbi:FAD-binding oxidoreductase [Corynebacterium hansenii]|uniref:FAD-binding oxidoreductase n=1 Tax=Corynebacterium hansenii TaxID=394964 RepID=A0ABV7ZR24_9CORY|nr:FAD-binding oxidoreductase [Corynebacterium hansenii]WJZ01161.1 Ferredoxin--NAD(P)(+) reductase (naphthalene dioxygenase/salicylate 5-hydroxylase ferredoxin-specific) [Corynebacterium hansenii]